jgi:Hg(II)-responsive transcriptional regulator
MASSLKSGELAKLADVHVETLRYYEREGLLAEPERSESGYRLYCPDDVKTVRFIKHAQELGFTLKEVKELLTLKQMTGHSAGEVKELAERKIQVINQKIQDLEAMKTTLLTLIEACPGGDESIDNCPIMQSLEDI